MSEFDKHMRRELESCRTYEDLIKWAKQVSNPNRRLDAKLLASGHRVVPYEVPKTRIGRIVDFVTAPFRWLR